MQTIKLGDRGKDKITGYIGIVLVKSQHLNGCNRVGVASEKINKDGSIADCVWFDEVQVEVVKKQVHAEPEPVATGGPATKMNPDPKQAHGN